MVLIIFIEEENPIQIVDIQLPRSKPPNGNELGPSTSSSSSAIQIQNAIDPQEEQEEQFSTEAAEENDQRNEVEVMDKRGKFN
jgi:hypothetical protein